MAQIKKEIGRFMGIGIKLHFRSGQKENLGNGLIISDGEKVHVWVEKKLGNKISFVIPTASVRELDVKILEKATYRNMETGNFEVFVF